MFLRRIKAAVEGALRVRASLSQPTLSSQSDHTYRVYTRDFDVVVEAEKLSDVLGRLPFSQRAAHERAWAALSGALQGWRTETQLVALQASARIRRDVTEGELTDTAVAILVDQSGSMRGQSMLLAAASCDVAQDFLSHLGVAVEILGFTTVSWRGGRARKRWLRRREPHPGRLCELLHVIYRSGDDRRASGQAFKEMLRPDLPKENVDGEALEWALSRLMRRPESNKIVLVISDGAPVDDSTLVANDLGYLDRHLREVVKRIEAARLVRLAGIGIGFDTSRYYSASEKVHTAIDLGPRVIGVLERLIRRDEGACAVEAGAV